MKKLLEHTSFTVIALPRYVKKLIAISVDLSLAVLTVWLAFYLRLGEWTALSLAGWPAAVVAALLAPPIFIAFGLYRAVFRYVGQEAFMAVCQAVVVYGIIYAAIFTAWSIPGVPRTVGIIQPILLLVVIGANRALGRYWLGGLAKQQSLRGPDTKRVLIYGAGRSGQQLSTALSIDPGHLVAGYVDDAKELQGSFISGHRIWSPADLPQLVRKLAIDEVLLAMPSASRARRNRILQLIRQEGLSVRTLPGMADLAAGRVTVTDLRALAAEDLLGRDAVPPDNNLLSQNIESRCILVTGAGGSIGSELCRQLVRFRPDRILLVDSNEFSLYSIHGELVRFLQANELEHVKVVPLLASVCDRSRMSSIFSRWRPELVFHAAAYKHVPLVEQNVVEGVRNNVLGTFITASLARTFEVARFVLISTDKAVRPTSVMGASKRLAEMILQSLALQQGGTCFTMVRFGNVLESSGSVVPLFRQQIAAGGPVTVTHPQVTRYFMTIPEAAQLVLQAGTMARGGEVFVLDMGEPVSIYDLAVKMVELSGLKVKADELSDGDIRIIFTGLRPGEKLYEELLIGHNPQPTPHPRIMVADEDCLSPEQLLDELNSLFKVIESQDEAMIRRLLKQIIPEFTPEGCGTATSSPASSKPVQPKVQRIA